MERLELLQGSIWLQTLHLAGDHLEPPQGPLVVPGPLVENHRPNSIDGCKHSVKSATCYQSTQSHDKYTTQQIHDSETTRCKQRETRHGANDDTRYGST